MTFGSFEISPEITSIREFNKIFDKNLKNAGATLEEARKFGEIFNSSDEKEPTKLNGIVSKTFGPDAIDMQKVENLSETAKMMNDIGRGFSGGIENLSKTQKEAEGAMETFAAGGDISVHEVMIASQKSALAMQMAINLRNQMINAYNEFKNMHV